MKFQLIFGAIVLILISRYVLCLVKGKIKAKRFMLIFAFWLAVFFAIVFPESTNEIAHFFNITRGADFFIYISIMAVFYLIFRIFERIEKIERNITELTRNLALMEKERSDREKK